jgi:hypothetical protein
MRLEFMNSISTFWLPEKLTTIFCMALFLLGILEVKQLHADDQSTAGTNAQPSEHVKLIKLPNIILEKVNLHDGLWKEAFTVTANFFQIKPEKLMGDPKQEVYNVKDQLIAKGVLFTPGRSAVYLPVKKELIVVNDSEQLELIEELLNAWYSPTVITKSTKFITIP